MNLSEAQEKIDGIKNKSEQNVGSLLLNLGFTLIDADAIIVNSSKQRIGELDLIFTFGESIFLVEVSKDKHSGSSKKISFFSKWSGNNNLKILKRKYQLGPKKVFRIYFDLSKKSLEKESAEIENITKKGTMNKVAYYDDYEYFLDCRQKIGPWAKNDLLDWLDYSDEKTSRQIDAIQYYIGEIPVFCFIERVDNLLQTCYISRRRTQDLGYQRTLKTNRIINIANNIKNGKGLSFPNSILINAPELTENILPPEDCPALRKIHFPIGTNTCRIIDGQHRLLGFSIVPNVIQRSYYLPVIALQKYEPEKEIETFVDINSKQERIDSNLILLLKADLDWKPGTREFKNKIAVSVAQKLNRSFFKNRVFLGIANETKGDKITLTTLVSGMVRNDQVEDTIDKTYKKLTEILKFMRIYLPEHSFKSNTYFGHNRGISVLFRLLRLLQRNIESKKISVREEDFFKDLRKIFDKKLIKNLDDYYGEGGAKAAAELIIGELQSRFPNKYKEMKANLKYIPQPKSKK